MCRLRKRRAVQHAAVLLGALLFGLLASVAGATDNCPTSACRNVHAWVKQPEKLNEPAFVGEPLAVVVAGHNYGGGQSVNIKADCFGGGGTKHYEIRWDNIWLAPGPFQLEGSFVPEVAGHHGCAVGIWTKAGCEVVYSKNTLNVSIEDAACAVPVVCSTCPPKCEPFADLATSASAMSSCMDGSKSWTKKTWCQKLLEICRFQCDTSW